MAFDSVQRLVAADTDDSIDVYARVAGTTELISTGPATQNEEIPAKLLGVSGDGSRIAFNTVESLVSVDTDDRMDVYSRTVAGLERFGAGSPTAGASATAAATKRGRTVLLSAESVAPRMKVGRAAQSSPRRVKLKMTCPKTEETGPCRGSVRLKALGGRTSGKGTFSVKAGRSKPVTVKLRSSVKGGKSWKAIVRIKASDRLGNSARTSSRLTVRG